MGILEDLYYEHLETHPAQYSEDSEICKVNSEIKKVKEIILDRLSGEDRDWFLKFLTLSNQCTALTNAKNFSEGIRIGAKFMKEIFCKEDFAL